MEKELSQNSCPQCHQADQFDPIAGKCRRCQPPSRAVVILEKIFRFGFLLLASVAALAVLIRVGSYMVTTIYKIFKHYLSS